MADLVRVVVDALAGHLHEAVSADAEAGEAHLLPDRGPEGLRPRDALEGGALEIEEIVFGAPDAHSLLCEAGGIVSEVVLHPRGGDDGESRAVRDLLAR